MSTHNLYGKIQTVLGVIEPDTLGVTLSHEHVLWNASFQYVEPEQREMGSEPVRMENLEWLKRNGVGNIDNLIQLDESLAVKELLRFKNNGGGAVVDMSNHGLHRTPEGLTRVSEATGLHIIMGTGYYVGASHPKELKKTRVDLLVDEMVTDITVGADGTPIKSGVIGEIGCSYPLTEAEIKVLEATAVAQSKTGVPVNIHPGQSQSSPMEIIDLYRSFGGDVKHTAISHIGNRHGLDIGLTLELARTGCYIDYDSFGNYQNPIILPEKTFYALDDWQRIQCIKELIDKGYLSQLLIAHDIFNKTDLRHYGGFGYDHIHKTVIPLMHMNGIKDEEIDKMLIDNPKRFFQFSLS